MYPLGKNMLYAIFSFDYHNTNKCSCQRFEKNIVETVVELISVLASNASVATNAKNAPLPKIGLDAFLLVGDTVPKPLRSAFGNAGCAPKRRFVSPADARGFWKTYRITVRHISGNMMVSEAHDQTEAFILNATKSKLQIKVFFDRMKQKPHREKSYHDRRMCSYVRRTAACVRGFEQNPEVIGKYFLEMWG